MLDTESYPMRTGLREIAKIHDGDFRLTANQNLVIANISPKKRPQIEKLLEQYGIKDSHEKSSLRLNSLACVALPTPCRPCTACPGPWAPILISWSHTGRKRASPDPRGQKPPNSGHPRASAHCNY